MKTKVIIPDDQVKIKLSVCKKCGNMVRAAVSHQMTRKMKIEFMNEVMDHDLSVETITLPEYRERNLNFCKCK